MERYRVVARDNYGAVLDETLDDWALAQDRLLEVLMKYGETHLVDLEFLREGDE